MPSEHTRRSLTLSPDEWATLERLAAETGSEAQRGPTPGEPSWRTLVKRIAKGELKIKVKS
jgi:hypothetical protein